MNEIPRGLITSFCSIVGANPKFSFVTTLPTKHISNHSDIELTCKTFYSYPTIWRGAPGTSKVRVYNSSNALKYGVPYLKLNEITYNDGVKHALYNFSLKIYNYFNLKPNTANKQINFNCFHNDLCNGFMNDLNTARRLVGYANITYGQAQKYVNVIFKYLSCFNDYPTYADLFSYCHMAIDTNVLWALQHWFRVPGIVSSCRRGLFTGIYLGSSWTSLSFAQYALLFSSYEPILRKMFPNNSLLEIEFVIWNSLRGASMPMTFSGCISTTSVSTIGKFYM